MLINNSNSLKKLNKLAWIFKRFESSLYIGGDKANKTYAVLHPFMNFNDVFNNPDLMKENLRARNLINNFNSIEQKFKLCKLAANEKLEVDKKREEIVKQLRNLEKTTNFDQHKVNELKQHGKNLREKLKHLRDNSYKIEDEFIHEFLNLPNKLDDRCPREYERLLYRQGIPIDKKKIISHLNRNDLINYIDSTNYYLLNEAADFDLEILHNFAKYFSGKHNFIQMINPDFSRKILLEAASDVNTIKLELDDNLSDTENLFKINTLHLNGGGSMTSFLGLISKLTIFPSVLPLKYVACGRKYHHFDDGSKGLFTATQSNSCQVFVATDTEENAQIEMDKILNIMVDIYKKFNVHFKIAIEPAINLELSESLKISIKMYSYNLKEYIEIGSISNYTNFISKRLLFNYKEKKQYKFPFIIAGHILDTSKLIGCLIENDYDLKSIPSFINEKTALEDFKDLFK